MNRQQRRAQAREGTPVRAAAGGVEARFEAAQASHRAGRWAEAEAGYREILARQPRHAQALHQLGVLALQTGHPEPALALLQQARGADPKSAEIHGNLGTALARMGRHGEAAEALREALRLRPDYPEALLNLGAAWIRLGKGEAALGCFREATRFPTLAPEAWNHLGNTLRPLGRLGEAVKAYREAIRLRPAYDDAWNHLGVALRELGRSDEAAAALREALRLAPGSFEAMNNLGTLLSTMGERQEGAALLEQANRLRPDQPETLNNLGTALAAAGRWEASIAAYRRATTLYPNYADAWCNLGIVLRERGDFDAALRALRQALALVPRLAPALNNLGVALMEAGRIPEATLAFRQALEAAPRFAEARGNLLLALNYDGSVSLEEIAREAGEWARLHAAVPSKSAPSPSPGAARIEGGGDGERPLRVGFVSPDLRRHSVSYFLAPLLAHLDRRRISPWCYADLPQMDEVSHRLRGLSDGWRLTLGLGDEALAEQVRADGLDVLVDLAGHTANNRLGLFSHRPAPVALSWLGYPATTGSPAIGWRLTDPIADPPSPREEACYSERLFRLEAPFLCYEPPADAPPLSDDPVPAKGDGEGVVFGSFNNLAKLSDETTALWSELLHRVPGSRLLLKHRAFSSQETLQWHQARFAAHGIPPERLLLRDFIPDAAGHLALYDRIDVALDPLPYNGTTTTCEALWMGVPVVTLRGDRHAGRVGATLLTAVGCAEWVAGDAEEYLRLAATLAGERGGLRPSRRALRQRMADSPLMDGPGFARNLTEALERLTGRHPFGLPLVQEILP
ncbi:MAG: tetratricopeptide repeat protein [Magnetococcales bacterium]|nr:tetratricopeptide repeat protein [Magnetococcales bacterium]